QLQRDLRSRELGQPRRSHQRRPADVGSNPPPRAHHINKVHGLCFTAGNAESISSQGPYRCRSRSSPSCSVKADRASTSPTPAWRAALITSVCTCDAYPSVGMDESAGSACMAATMPSGLRRSLLRSKMTSDGGFLRIVSSAPSSDRENLRSTPSWLAAVLIFELNIRSSSTAKIMDDHDN